MQDIQLHTSVETVLAKKESMCRVDSSVVPLCIMGEMETKSRKETMYTCASDLGPRGCYIMVDYISHHLLFTGDNNSIDTIDKTG